MAQTEETDRYLVVGNPIAHSKSPRIHQLFAAQTSQHIQYDALLVEPDGFAAALDAFQREGGKGANVTVPFKQDAWQWVSQRSERATRARAVNTIVLREDGGRYGDNTDGIGLLRDISDNCHVTLSGAAVLVLGAGGAARGVIEPLLKQAPATLAIANRTVSKAQALADDFSDLGAIEACAFSELAGQQFDVVINATSASLHGESLALPNTLLHPGATCYDMMYGPKPTPFLRWAAERGAANVVDGLGMLVEQAAEAFALWRGVRPRTVEVIAELRRELAD